MKLDLVSLVIAIAQPPRGMDPEHHKVLGLCRNPISVAEVAAHMRLPVAVTKILLADLVECEAMAMRAPSTTSGATDRVLLEKLLDGLQGI
ncbi:DUF742 domain-containing protein [Actinoallomurus iriomotensis]|uniref:DUF742 domain-containing protein n=1 Tax=Actinoallomurus iriomotensis TaxID=478107 RepID=UPI002553C192|nr:DUF742 domain-containing protein [Actinoallomurus iriomotensis]